MSTHKKCVNSCHRFSIFRFFNPSLQICAGAIRARYDYDPFGRTTKVQGDLDADFRYTGFYYDQATGLYFSGTRVYSPDLARWLTRDTIGEGGGINLYRYVENNPVNNVDPSGRFTIVEVGIGLGLLGAGLLYLALNPPHPIFIPPSALPGYNPGIPVDNPFPPSQGPDSPTQPESFPWEQPYDPYAPLVFPDSPDWNIPYSNDMAGHRKKRPCMSDVYTKPRAGGPEKKDPRMDQKPPPRGPKPPKPPKPPGYFKGPKIK